MRRMHSASEPPTTRAEDLLARWQRHADREALDELLAIEIRLLKQRIRAQELHRIEGDASVSDVVQETVFRMLRLDTPPVFETPQAMRAYLWTAAWRLLVAQLRAQKPKHLDSSASGAFDEALQTTGGVGEVERRDRGIALEVALRLLEPEEQEVLDLVVVRNLGHAGAAVQLGISPDAVKTRCRRARERLAHKLKHWNELIG